jgi:hypothetical protein
MTPQVPWNSYAVCAVSQLHTLECNTVCLDISKQYEKHEQKRRTASSVQPMSLPLCKIRLGAGLGKISLKLLNPGLAGSKPPRSIPYSERKTATRLSDQPTIMHYRRQCPQTDNVAGLRRSNCRVIDVVLRTCCLLFISSRPDRKRQVGGAVHKTMGTSVETALELRQRNLVPRPNFFNGLQPLADEWTESREKLR